MLSVRSPVSGTRIPAGNTAIILTDPYNDFLDPEGKLTPRLSESIKAVGTIENLRKVVVAARAAKLPIFYSLHHQHTAHDCERLYGRTTASNNLMLRSDMGSPTRTSPRPTSASTRSSSFQREAGAPRSTRDWSRTWMQETL